MKWDHGLELKMLIKLREFLKKIKFQIFQKKRKKDKNRNKDKYAKIQERWLSTQK